MSPDQMRTQRMATARNSTIESMVHAMLVILGENLLADGHLSNAPAVESQVRWQSELNSDVWDHRFTGLDVTGETWVIWAQTTNYKGHASGKAESNKTYEVRETLTEALTMRATWPENENNRSVHFTVGPSDYAYGWFEPMKSYSFDRSIYVSIPGEDIFSAIESLLASARTESQVLGKVRDAMASMSPLGQVLRLPIEELRNWWLREGLAPNPIADAQAQLVRMAIPKPEGVDSVMKEGSASGFKNAVVESILAGRHLHDDPGIKEAVKQTLEAKPFLASARQQVGDWSAFCQRVKGIAQSEIPLQNALIQLWQAEDSDIRESLRRILMRLRVADETDYIQDVNIQGLSEHNLYGPLHSSEQAFKIAQIISGNLPTDIANTSQLIARIEQQGRHMLREQIFFEARNGTNAAMSFRTVIQLLTHDGYVVEPPSSLAKPLVGYQRELTRETVRPYTNFRVISHRNGKQLAVLKAKHFSAREFDRRCKEEGFVGLSLTKAWIDDEFVSGLSLPLVMCIDVEDKADLSSIGISKLMAMGWTVVVGYPALKKLVATLGE